MTILGVAEDPAAKAFSLLVFRDGMNCETVLVGSGRGVKYKVVWDPMVPELSQIKAFSV